MSLDDTQAASDVPDVPNLLPNNIELRIDSPLKQRQHEDGDRHLIGEALPPPNFTSPLGSINYSVGSSPFPARADHIHNIERLLIPEGISDVTLTSDDNPVQIGSVSGRNLVMDNNEIQVRLNGAADQLFINVLGGNIRLGKAGDSFISMQCSFAELKGTANQVLTLDATFTSSPYIAINGGTSNTRAMYIGNPNPTTNDVYMVADKGDLIIYSTSGDCYFNNNAFIDVGRMDMRIATGEKILLYGSTYSIGIQSNTAFIRSNKWVSAYSGGTFVSTENTEGAGGSRIFSMHSLECFIPGVYASTTSSASNVYIGGSGGKLSRSTSSIRYKTDVEDLELDRAYDIILKSRPVWFRSTSKADNPNHSFIGLIAEDVAHISPNLTFYNTPTKCACPVGIDDPWWEHSCYRPEGVQYDRFVAPIISVLKDMNSRLKALENG